MSALEELRDIVLFLGATKKSRGNKTNYFPREQTSVLLYKKSQWHS
jgi:hypothetical protein